MYSAVLVHHLHEMKKYSIYFLSASYFGFIEELSEAASRVLLGMGSQLQDELHDHSLVGHLLHQSLFLQDRNQKRLRIEKK